MGIDVGTDVKKFPATTLSDIRRGVTSLSGAYAETMDEVQ